MPLKMYNIDLNNTPIGDYSYTYTLDNAFFQALEQQEIKGGNIQATIQLKVLENTCTLNIQTMGAVNIICDRCLDEMTQNIEANEELLVKIETPDEETIDEDAIYVDPKSGILNLAWLIYELIEINLPLVHSHQQGECNPQMQELLQTHLCTMEEPEE